MSDPASTEGAALGPAEILGGPDVIVNHAGTDPDFALAAADPEFALARRALDPQTFGASRLTARPVASSGTAGRSPSERIPPGTGAR